MVGDRKRVPVILHPNVRVKGRLDNCSSSPERLQDTCYINPIVLCLYFLYKPEKKYVNKSTNLEGFVQWFYLKKFILNY